MTDPDVRDALRTIAASSFDSRRGRRALVPAEGEDAFLEGVSQERLGGLAVEAFDRGDLVLSEPAVEELFLRHEDQLALDLRLERVLADATAILDAAGVEYRALKGPALARLVYRDPALRSFGDVDILVRSVTFDRAVDALQPLGFHRRFIEPRRGFDARFSKGACLDRSDRVELDLHRTLAPGAFGIMLDRARLFARAPLRFQLGQASIACLDRDLAFVHACFHSALGDLPARLVPLRDVAELFRAGIAGDDVIALATSVHCEVVFQRALELVETELGVRLEGDLPNWARAYQPSRFDQWALQSYTGTRRSYAGQVATSFWAMPSVRARVAYGSALLFPTRDYVRARERGYGRRLRRGLGVAKESRPR